MIIGVVKERKAQENRVGLVPAGVKPLIDLGCKVWVETDAGLGSGLSNEAYTTEGATIVKDRMQIYSDADLIMKVKEPLPDEVELYHEGQTLYTYLHLAADKELTERLTATGVTAIAYETIQLDDGSLPLLQPMSEVAGRMSVQLGATYLQKNHRGKGVLLGGVPGVHRGKITVIGSGVVGKNAIKIAVGLGAEVRVLDINLRRLDYLDDIYGNRLTTLYSNHTNIQESVAWADLTIGAVLVPGAKSPRLVTREMLDNIEDGSVLVDVSVDQGGCFETSKPTTYDDPTYVVDGVIHCGIANIPGTVARSSTYALTNVTLPYALTMAKKGIEKAVKEDIALARGVNTYKKQLVCKVVADDHDMPYAPLDQLI